MTTSSVTAPRPAAMAPTAAFASRPRLAVSGRLAAARAAQGIPVAAAAAALGVPPVTILVWEAGLEPPPGAAAVVEEWLADLAGGQVPVARHVPQYTLCEERRRATAGLATLRREIHSVHRWLLTANEDNDEQLMLAHESLATALDHTTPPRRRASLEDVVASRLRAVEDRLAEMQRRVTYLRTLSDTALAAAAQAGTEAA